MKQISNKEYEKDQQYQTDKLHGWILTPDGLLTYDFKYGRQTGTEDQTTKQVPFSLSNIDQNNLQRIKERLPYAYALIAPSLK